MFQTGGFTIRGFSGFVFVFCKGCYKNLNGKLRKSLVLRQMGLKNYWLNPLNPELNLICYLLALLGAHHFLHVSRTRVKLLTLRLLMSNIYGVPILDVSRSHTTTQHIL